jgi:hypothetical protein
MAGAEQTARLLVSAPHPHSRGTLDHVLLLSELRSDSGFLHDFFLRSFWACLSILQCLALTRFSVTSSSTDARYIQDLRVGSWDNAGCSYTALPQDDSINGSAKHFRNTLDHLRYPLLGLQGKHTITILRRQKANCWKFAHLPVWKNALKTKFLIYREKYPCWLCNPK